MPLTPAKTQALDIFHAEGRLTGVASAYHKLREGDLRITKEDISQYMRSRPSIQEHRLPHATDGEKNTVSAVISPPIPLSMTFSGTMFSSGRALATGTAWAGLCLIHHHPCKHKRTSQQRPSCVLVSGFAAVGVRNPTGDGANFQSEFGCASSVAFSLGTQRSPRRGRARFVWFLICTLP